MKLKVPDEVLLYSIANRIEIKDIPGLCGEYDYNTKIISIDPEVAERARTEILFHEVMEAINVTLELHLPHWKINAIGEGFHEFILNNIERMISDDLA